MRRKRPFNATLGEIFKMARQQGSAKKEEKLEKIIEWEQKPNWFLFGVGLLIVLHLFIGLAWSSQKCPNGEQEECYPTQFYNETLSNYSLAIFSLIGIITSFFGGFYLMFRFVGLNKKVYWRRI